MKKYFIAGIVLVGILGIGIYVFRHEYLEKNMEVYFFHLNKGRSIFIRSPLGKTLLIDGGQNSEVIRELSKVLPFYRRRIDVVIVTNSQSKNVGGLSEVVDRYEIGRVIEPILIGTSTALELFQRKVRAKGIEVEKVKKGDRFAIDSMQFDVFFPDPDFRYNKTSLPELVLKIGYSEKTLLFLGDVSITIQKSFLKELDKAYLVEFAHGATKSRISADLLDKLEPRIVVSSKREETLRFKFDKIIK